MVPLISVSVVIRYFTPFSVAWVTEVLEYCLFFMTFLGCVWVLKEDGHVKIDLIVSHLAPTTRRNFAMVSNLIGSITCWVSAYYAALFTWKNYVSGSPIVKFIALPRYLLLFAITIALLLLAFQFLYNWWKYLKNSEVIEIDKTDLTTSL